MSFTPTRRQVLLSAVALAACAPLSESSPDGGLADADAPDEGAPDAAAPPVNPPDVGGATVASNGDGNVLRFEDEGGVVRWVGTREDRALILGPETIELTSAFGDGGLYTRGLGPSLEQDIRQFFGDTVLDDLRRALAASA